MLIIYMIHPQVKDDGGYTVTLHYNDKEFSYKITKKIEDWDEEILCDTQLTMRKEFGITSDFGLYENIDGSRVDIDGEDDLISSFEDKVEGESGAAQLTHLFVSVTSMYTFIFLCCVFVNELFCHCLRH